MVLNDARNSNGCYADRKNSTMSEPVLAVLLGPEDQVLLVQWIPKFLDRLSVAQVDRATLFTAATVDTVVELLQVDYEYDAVESELQRMIHPVAVCVYKQRS